MIHFKKVKRKCGVRGCRNTESFHLSCRREFGNSVIICRECLAAALKATASEEHTADKQKPVEETGAVEETEVAEETGFICPGCGKSFGTEKGLKTHIRHCGDADLNGDGNAD